FTPVVHSIIAGLRPSARGELEITEAIWRMHQQGLAIRVQPVEGWWKDTGRPRDLLEANEMVLRTAPEGRFRIAGRVEPGAVVEGRVDLGAGSTVEAGARIEGPVVIGA